MSSSQMSEQERMRKLAVMLDNSSNNASQVTSNFNSRPNTQRSNGTKRQPGLMDRQSGQFGQIHQLSQETNSLLMSPNTIREQYTE